MNDMNLKFLFSFKIKVLVCLRLYLVLQSCNVLVVFSPFVHTLDTRPNINILIID